MEVEWYEHQSEAVLAPSSSPLAYQVDCQFDLVDRYRWQCDLEKYTQHEGHKCNKDLDKQKLN